MANPPGPSTIDWSAVETEAARLLSQYIQFDTTNPPGNEASAVEFLADILRDRGFEPHILTPAGTYFFQALAQTLQRIGPPGLAIPYLSPGATDSRFFRRAGMKAYGFLPMLLDVRELNRIHGIDKRVSTANLRWGTRVVVDTPEKLCCCTG